MTLVIDKPGFYPDVPAATYHGDPCITPSLSSSLAVDILTEAPVKAFIKHPRLSGTKSAVVETAEMSFGSVVHELALGRGGGFAVWKGETWRGKEAASFWDDAIAAGKTPIKYTDFERALLLIDAARKQLKSMGLEYVLDGGQSEIVAAWKHGEHWMRAMFDKWFHDRGEIWDIKTTATLAHPDKISRFVASMDYDMRSEFYLMGAEVLTGIPARRGGIGFQFLFIETEPPFLVTPCFLSESYRTRGKQRARQAIDIWSRCMESGEWPGYVASTVEIQAPGWVEFEIEETGITASGERIL